MLHWTVFVHVVLNKPSVFPSLVKTIFVLESRQTELPVYGWPKNKTPKKPKNPKPKWPKTKKHALENLVFLVSKVL